MDAKTLSDRVPFILNCPVFAVLNGDQAKELAALMKEIHYETGQVIVSEDEIVDQVFIITKGRAEVSQLQKPKRKLLFKAKKSQVPIATLNVGETIGLTDTGFFSETGRRTATVTAIEPTTVLSLSVKLLQEFLQKNHLLERMEQRAEELLRIQLIKASLPFRKLGFDRLLSLANKVEKIKIPKNTLIFKQGDPGDRCFLISSGEVQIFSEDQNNEEKKLAELRSPTLFGEATLITRSPRNASAKAMVDSELLVLRYEYLTELLESEDNVASMFMTLMVDRSKPSKNTHIISNSFTTADNQEMVILKNPENGTYFKLSEEGAFIWDEMDGKHTMQDITLALAKKYHIFAPNLVAGLISKLAKAEFVTNVTVDTQKKLTHEPRWVKAVSFIRKILESRIAIGDADKWLTQIYNKGAFLFFTLFGTIVLITLAITGFIAFLISADNVMLIFETFKDTWLIIILLIPFMIFSVVLHELGHAFATKLYQREVHYMGVGWYWLGPVAFTDTSDMWLSKKRWPRIHVNLAGVYVDSITAGVSALLIFVIPNPYIQAFLWVFALFTYVNAFRMLSPLQELDGYYVLMDVVDTPHLRQKAVTWLLKIFPKSFKNPALFKQHWPEIFYWLACIIFLVLVTLLTLLIQGFVLKILNLSTGNSFVSLLLPFIVVIFSSLGVIADIKSQAED